MLHMTLFIFVYPPPPPRTHTPAHACNVQLWCLLYLSWYKFIDPSVTFYPNFIVVTNFAVLWLTWMCDCEWVSLAPGHVPCAVTLTLDNKAVLLWIVLLLAVVPKLVKGKHLDVMKTQSSLSVSSRSPSLLHSPTLILSTRFAWYW